MEELLKALEAGGDALPGGEDATLRSVARLSEALGLKVYPRSIEVRQGTLYALVREHKEPDRMICIARPSGRELHPACGESCEMRTVEITGRKLTVVLRPGDDAGAEVLRQWLPWSAPRPVGLVRSFGCGDRLGLATPAHVRAARTAGGKMTPFFPQQSIREMARTGRTPEDVMRDAVVGVFQEGWRSGFGSDADHLKNAEDVDRCVSAGFTMFTVDPGDHVDNQADSAAPAELADRFARLPFSDLETSPADLKRRYAGKTFNLDAGAAISFDDTAFLRAAVKYGAAVAHTVRMYRHLVSKTGETPFELEMSVDETETPTKPEEHYLVASELKRLGVEVVSLAPRFVGRFEKGVDYIGDLGEFERAFAEHAAIARTLGPYKLSIHSGSDKFSVYPVIARIAGELVHVKTAGTSYLEAVRAAARIDPQLFREIYVFAMDRYETDRATYHVSASKAKAPDVSRLRDTELPSVLDSFDGRQILHVTYGSVLTDESLRGRLLDALRSDEEVHYEAIEAHLAKHMKPFG